MTSLSGNAKGRPTTLPEVSRAGSKCCAMCGPKPLTDFYRNSRSKDTFSPVCKECQKLRVRRTYPNDDTRRALNAAYMREWRKRKRAAN